MKLRQIAVTALAAITLGTCRVKAFDFAGTTTDYSKVNFALVIQSQNTNSANAKFKITKHKITNKSLLQLLAIRRPALTNGTFKAQFEYDWTTDELILADQTGTNILRYLDSPGKTNFFSLDFQNQEGPFTGTDDGIVYTYKGTSYNIGKLEIDAPALGIDILGQGLSVVKYTSAHGKWSGSAKFNVVGYWNSEQGTDILVGRITAKGRGVLQDYAF